MQCGDEDDSFSLITCGPGSLTPNLLVGVVGVKAVKGGATAYVLRCSVVKTSLEWLVERRYSDFVEVRDELQRFFAAPRVFQCFGCRWFAQALRHYRFPRRRLFSSGSSRAVRKRRVELHQFACLLAAHSFSSVPKCTKCTQSVFRTVCDFFSLGATATRATSAAAIANALQPHKFAPISDPSKSKLEFRRRQGIWKVVQAEKPVFSKLSDYERHQRELAELFEVAQRALPPSQRGATAMPALKHEFLGAVTLLRFSASGQLLYAGVGAELYLYDAASGALVGRRAVLPRGVLHGCDCADHLTQVAAVRRIGAFFGQKRVACFARLPQRARDFVVADGDGCLTRVGRPRVFRDWVFDARVLTDGAEPRVAVGLAHNLVQIWSPGSDRIERSVQCGERCILYALTFYGRTLDELVVAAGTVFQHILLWNPAESDAAAIVHPAQRLHAHDGVIFKLAWSEDARQLASVSDDRTVQLWSNAAQSGEHGGRVDRLDRDALLRTPFSPVFRAWGHAARVWDVQFCAPSRLVSASEDGVCKIWSERGDCLATLAGHMGRHVWRVSVRQPLVDGGAAVVATGGGDGAVKLWDVDQQIWASTAATPGHEAHSSAYGYSRTISVAPPAVGSTEGDKKAAAATNGVRSILVSSLDGGETAFVAMESGEILRVTLATGDASHLFAASSDGKTSGLSAFALGMDDRLLLLGDMCGRVSAVSTRTGELVYSWTAHNRARIMKIWWVQHDKSPALFTSSADGSLIEWVPDLDDASQPSVLLGVSIVATFRCPGKCAASALVVLDRAPSMRNVICGDGRGSVFVFHRSLDERGDDTGTESAVHPATVLRAVHGREQVSTLLLDGVGSDGDASRLLSGGFDGSICTLLVEPKETANDTGAVTLRLANRESIKGLSTVKLLAWHGGASRDAVAGRELLVFGFHATTAVLHNLTAQYRVFNLACGGWRRPHALWLSPDGGGEPRAALPSHAFVFAAPTSLKAKAPTRAVEIAVHSTLRSLSGLARASLREALHGKMTTCVAFVDAERLVTAAEDNSVMLHKRLPGETLLVSAGGKQRVNVWRVRDAEARDADVLQLVCGYEPRGAPQDHRILALATLELAPAVSERFRLVAGGNSDGRVPLLLLDMERECLTPLGELALPSRKPILSCAAVQRAGVSVLALGSTDGRVSLFDVSDWLARLSHALVATETAALPLEAEAESEALRALASAAEPASSFVAHDMGVNCLTVAASLGSEASTSVALLSGGDDQSLRLHELSLPSLRVMREAAAVNASGSAIKAVASAGDAVLAAGYDQRVSLFRVVSGGAGALALEWQSAAVSECADIAALAVRPAAAAADAPIVAVVVGEGLQTVEFVRDER